MNENFTGELVLRATEQLLLLYKALFMTLSSKLVASLFLLILCYLQLKFKQK